jgi:hypothetical protein
MEWFSTGDICKQPSITNNNKSLFKSILYKKYKYFYKKYKSISSIDNNIHINILVISKEEQYLALRFIASLHGTRYVGSWWTL